MCTRRWLSLMLSTATLGIGVGWAAPSHAAKKFQIYLSMSYIGNDWQAEAENEIKAMAASKSMRDKVDLHIQVAGPNAERQIQQINAMIQAGAQAILVYPISPTALNAVAKAACDRGIVVAAYDSSSASRALTTSTSIRSSGAATRRDGWSNSSMARVTS